MKKLVVLMVCLGVLGFIGSAQAMPITYAFESIGTGTIGSQSFSNADVIVSFVSDTGNVIQYTGGFFANSVGTGTISIFGIGTAGFTDSIYVFCSQNYPATVGIYDRFAIGPGPILETQNNSAFFKYPLTTAIGPISGSTIFGPGTFCGTTLGTLNFSAMSSDSIFTATTSTVPVPASILLFGPGLACLAAARRRFKR